MDIDLKTLAIRIKEKEDGSLFVILRTRDPRHTDKILCGEYLLERLDGSTERLFVTGAFVEQAFKLGRPTEIDA